MSSDFLHDVEDDMLNSVDLTMYVDGFAELTISEHDKLIDDIEAKIISFRLTLNEFGWSNAAKIANALSNWVEHTNKINI